ncbi:hypothetical protein ACRB68_25990 [Actinomadura sp. RB68]|uniref:HTH araC/xylS-type domain-containing protein n=1 Tax=Actinomadura macrotermitis TaxID=2585200 RepID=A0A7K0BV53_9ACTN|nr:hypothetical protein [Actinomadura macrotermitis]
MEWCRRDLAGRPVRAIGAKLGLTDPTRFGRIFREPCGMAPARYRQHHALSTAAG